MFRRIALAALAAVFLALPSRAADWTAPVKQVIICTESWFEIELVGKTMPHSGTTKQVRFMVKASLVGAERYKQMYAMALTAFAVQSQVWLGTTQANTTTSTSGGNCNTNNMPAQDVGGISAYR